MGKQTHFLVVNLAFLISGVSQTLMAYHFVQLGFAKDSSNYINAMGNPLGQFLFAALDVRLWRNWSKTLLLSGLPIAICELGFNFFAQFAIAKIGSGMYQVVFSFVVVMNAIPGHFCLGKPLNAGRWGAIVVIVAAVVLSATAQLESPGTDFSQQLLGCVSALIGTVFVSCVYVAANFLLSEPWDKPVPKPLVLAQMLGSAEVILIAIYFCARVVPSWGPLVSDNIKDDVTTGQCIAWYAAYLFACGVHQYAFYYSCSLGPSGAVTAAVNKCVQTAVLFFLSDWLYCSESEAQCLSDMKIVGAVGVCVGVLIYGYFGLTPKVAAAESIEEALVDADSQQLHRRSNSSVRT